MIFNSLISDFNWIIFSSRPTTSRLNLSRSSTYLFISSSAFFRSVISRDRAHGEPLIIQLERGNGKFHRKMIPLSIAGQNLEPVAENFPLSVNSKTLHAGPGFFPVRIRDRYIVKIKSQGFLFGKTEKLLRRLVPEN